MNKYIVNIERIKTNNVAKGFLPELTGQAGSLPHFLWTYTSKLSFLPQVGYRIIDNIIERIFL
ncbi:MAG: hypothetical protein A3H23_09355 [Planctomycetes bacterium RIFCSPLOWO2_12_FULL_40_19]|nr:MAG: hypothetical protein A3H23_09355 [Planctomycetes bacterium RIFCSPLOWO2_12_FULL_40_19]